MSDPERLRPLIFVGMSGVGKSHLARLLGTGGYRTFDVDSLIAAELHTLVTPERGEQPVAAVGRWMGMPWTAGFDAREAQYLALEERVTRRALDEAVTERLPTVIDTTGSVVYLPEPIQLRLAAEGCVVYLHTPPEDRARLCEQYLRKPKPVCWGGLFESRPGETTRSAVERLYPELLATRDARYAKLAHIRIEGPELHGVSAEALRARLGVEA